RRTGRRDRRGPSRGRGGRLARRERADRGLRGSPPRAVMRRRSELLLYLAAGLAALAVQLPIAAHWLSLLDEGYLLAIADALNRGKLLYRDVYVDAPFPRAFYVPAGSSSTAASS